MTQVFTVFLPNKTRYKLEISKFTPLYQGLEKVCIEKGYLPAQNFAFRYNKTYPDLGTPVGMLNLSNLTELELCPATEVPAKAGNNEGTVSIALQYSSQRHTDTCLCDASLWDVICQLAEKHPDWIPTADQKADEHPVLVYMRQEVPGEAALRGTSLRQLGLSPGGPPALLRLLRRTVPPERLAAAAQEAEARQRAAETIPVPVEEPVAAAQHSDLPPPSAVASAQATTASCSISAGGSFGVHDSDAEVSLFSPFREVPRPQAAPPQQPVSKEPRTLAEALNMPNFDDPRLQQQLPHQAPPPAAFGPDRPFRFPEETAGRDLYRNELSDVRPVEFAPCDRRLCGYVAGTALEPAASAAHSVSTGQEQLEEPDESFFNLTESDMRRMMADLKRKVECETNGPLLTRQQREQRREDLYSVYEHSVLRLFFPDRRVVQAAFRPRETVHALYKFVREQLLADWGTGTPDFFLYTTPPKKEIVDMAQYLIHADLVPMPIVHVGFRTPPPDGRELLKPEILALISCRADCDRVALACMRSAVEPIYAQQQQQQQPRQAQSGAASSSSGNSTVPKWFKK